MEPSVDAGPSNPEQYHLPIDGRQDKCILVFYPLVSSLCTYGSSLPVVYSNVALMEQLVVTWASLYCSHSYMLKETEEGAIVALICERQPLLLHQLLDGDLN